MAKPTPRLRGPAGVKQRKRRMARTHWLCEHCMAEGIVRQADVVDHIIPLVKGGPDTDDNTRNLCHDHHTDVTADQFGLRKRQQIGVDGWPIENKA